MVKLTVIDGKEQSTKTYNFIDVFEFEKKTYYIAYTNKKTEEKYVHVLREVSNKVVEVINDSELENRIYTMYTNTF